MRRGAAQRRSLPVVREPEPAETQRSPEPQAEPEQAAEASPEPEQPQPGGGYRVAPGRALCGGPRGMLQAGDPVTQADCGGCLKRLQGLCKGGYLVRDPA